MGVASGCGEQEVGVASGCGEQDAGVASGRMRVWLVGVGGTMGVATGYGCKEVYT